MLTYQKFVAMLLVSFALYSDNAQARITHYPDPSTPTTDTLAQESWYNTHEQQLYTVLQRLFGKAVYANLLANQHFLYLQEWLSTYNYQQRH